VPAAGNPSYSTTKHAVVGLSKVLRTEATAEGLRVSVLCPGFVRTPILEGGGKYGKALMELSSEQERYLRDLIEKFRPMSPDAFARKALDAIAKNKAIIVIPSWWKLLWWMDRLAPPLTQLQLQKSYEAMEKMTKG
jgi:short-subunit dehydrogenase